MSTERLAPAQAVVPEAPHRATRAHLIVQTKLEVGAAHDPLEHEADRVADLVMRTLESTLPARMADGEEPIGDANPRIRRAAAHPVLGSAGGPLDADTESRIQRSAGRGARLEPELQRDMDRGFGADFSTVRVHHDAESDRLNRQMQARAFTTGTDVFFRAGEYDPSSVDGRHLVAHELAHVVQQSPPVRRSIRRSAAATRPALVLGAGTAQRVIRRSIAPPDPSVNSSGEWRKVIGLVATYNAERDKAARDKAATSLEATLETLLETMKNSAARHPGPALEARIQAAQSVLQSLNADRARSSAATEEWMGAQAATRGTAQPGKLKTNHLTQQAISDTMTNKALEDDWRQTQLEFDGESGVNSRMGMTKTRTELKVAVNIPFKGQTGSIPVVKQAINTYWNTFKLVYKSSKSKGAPPVNKEIQLEFVLGKSTAATMKRADGSEFAPVLDSHHQAGDAPQPPAPPGGNWVRMGGYEGNFAVEPSNEVLLWSGDHPNWKQRDPDMSEHDRKTRSDAANWRVNDPDVEEMIAHEFGHLIGLPDEYSKRHGDIVAITGEQPKSYQSDGNLPSALNKQYTQIAWAIEQTRNDPNQVQHIVRSLNKLAGQDEMLSLMSAHHDKLTGKSIDRDLNDLAWSYKEKIQAASGRSARKQPNIDYKKVWDGVSKFVTDEAWVAALRAGFRSGGVMGDYHTVTGAGAGAPDQRPNAAAHDHKHPLEPRHVKRFADALGAIRNETWEPAHR